MNTPLAERLRPKSLDDYLGQKHLMAPNAGLRRAIDSGLIPSLILWGPPGVGKTTLANLIAQAMKRPFFSLSAVHSGVKEVREVIQKPSKTQFLTREKVQFYSSTKFIVFQNRSRILYSVLSKKALLHSSARPLKTLRLK